MKVGIGTLAVTALYEALLALPLDELDVDECCAVWPDAEKLARSANVTRGNAANATFAFT